MLVVPCVLVTPMQQQRCHGCHPAHAKSAQVARDDACARCRIEDEIAEGRADFEEDRDIPQHEPEPKLTTDA